MTSLLPAPPLRGSDSDDASAAQSGRKKRRLACAVQPSSRPPVVILVNGPSSSGKSTLCEALQEKIFDATGGDQLAAFASVAFDDFLRHMSTRHYPRSYVETVGGDLSRLASRTAHDGRLLTRTGF